MTVVRRLKQGKTLKEIVGYLIDNHPLGLKRSEIQERLKQDLGVGESTGGVNRQLKKLRQTAIIDWNQETYTYTLPQDYDSKEYFIRVTDTLDLNTDRAYFLATKLKEKISDGTKVQIDDYIGYRFDKEMNDNIMALQDGYKMNEIRVHDTISKLVKHHNAYVRMRLFKTTNECFIKDLTQIEEPKDAKSLTKSYTRNLKTAENQIKTETEGIFRLREELIKQLNEKRLSNRMKFLIRYTLNNVRPSHVYDGLI
jgi:hypothetical protein